MPDKSHIQSASTGSFAGRVGHKAGGFISKKFFHPSSFKNQEKLWAAIESKKEQEKRQEELMKKRDEERRVELLKKDLNQATDKRQNISSASVSGDFKKDATEVGVKEAPHSERSTVLETKRRLELLNQERLAESEAWPETKISVNSRYEEDVHEYGHTQVWGSYFDMGKKEWGYACCKHLIRLDYCLSAPSSPKRLKPSLH